MKHLDLGHLDTPVLLFGGPYSNLQATQALLAQTRARGIPASHVVCTGDIVAYCAAPAETLAAVREFGCPVVVGNCEKQLAANQDHCGCGFEAGSTCDLLSAGWYAHAGTEVGAEARHWMGALPDIITFTQQGHRVAVIHGGATDVSRFVWPMSGDDVFKEEIKEIQDNIGRISTVIAGHSGVPFQRRIGAVDWVNAGAIGMPSHDGRAQTCYAVLSGGHVQFHALSYDHEGACQDMRAVGLTQGYDTALLSGYWPSEDVLPPDLRRSALASG